MFHNIFDVLVGAVIKLSDLLANLGLCSHLRSLLNVFMRRSALDYIQSRWISQQSGHLLLKVLRPSGVKLDVVINTDLYGSICTR